MEADLQKVARENLRIIDVHLTNSALSSNENEDVISQLIMNGETKTQSFRNVSQIFESKLESPDGKRTGYEYRFIYALGIRLINKADEAESDDEDFKPLTEMVAHFSARYRCPEQLNEDVVNAFAPEDVCYHVWPYWREYVQSTCSRMGISPAFNIPHYFAKRENQVTD